MEMNFAKFYFYISLFLHCQYQLKEGACVCFKDMLSENIFQSTKALINFINLNYEIKISAVRR